MTSKEPIRSFQQWDIRYVSSTEDTEDWIKELHTPQTDADGIYYHRIDSLTVLPFPRRKAFSRETGPYPILIVHHRVYLDVPEGTTLHAAE